MASRLTSHLVKTLKRRHPNKYYHTASNNLNKISSYNYNYIYSNYNNNNNNHNYDLVKLSSSSDGTGSEPVDTDSSDGDIGDTTATPTSNSTNNNNDDNADYDITNSFHTSLRSSTPNEVVASLDEYIVGQSDAKKAVAIALRNRWRRKQLDDDFRNEIIPKNILMIGPTGCGKTEIARRLASLSQAPFLKVEATKFTEVGFHGRDVDQIIRDLVDVSINLTKKRRTEILRNEAKDIVEVMTTITFNDLVFFLSRSMALQCINRCPY